MNVDGAIDLKIYDEQLKTENRELNKKIKKIQEIIKEDYEKDCGDRADFFRIGDIRMIINGESRGE